VTLAALRSTALRLPAPAAGVPVRADVLGVRAARVLEHGPGRGGWLAFRRVLKCHPFIQEATTRRRSPGARLTMEKRALIAAVLMAALLLAYQMFFFPVPQEPPAPKPSPQTATPAVPPAAPAALRARHATAGSAALPAAARDRRDAPLPGRREQRGRETPGARPEVPRREADGHPRRTWAGRVADCTDAPSPPPSSLWTEHRRIAVAQNPDAGPVLTGDVDGLHVRQTLTVPPTTLRSTYRCGWRTTPARRAGHHRTALAHPPGVARDAKRSSRAAPDGDRLVVGRQIKSGSKD